MSLAEELVRIATRGLAAHIGIVVTEISESRVVATMPVNERTHQPFGILHGGASVVLAETVASIGALSKVDFEKFVAVGQEINANHLRGISSGTVTAVAKPVHLGRTSHVWSIEVRDEKDQLVCISRCTLAIVPKR